MNKIMRKPLSLIIGCLVVATSLCACRGDKEEKVDFKSIRNRPELEAAVFRFHKIIVEDGTRTLFNLLGWAPDILPDKILVLPVDITVVGKVDFSQVTEDNLIITEDKATFILPDPALVVSKIEKDEDMREKASKETKVPVFGKLQPFSDDEVKRIMTQAYDSIMIDRCLQMMVDRTRENAANVIIPLVAAVTEMDEESITIQFRSDLSLSDATLNKDKNGRDVILFKRKD